MGIFPRDKHFRRSHYLSLPFIVRIYTTSDTKAPIIFRSYNLPPVLPVLTGLSGGRAFPRDRHFRLPPCFSPPSVPRVSFACCADPQHLVVHHNGHLHLPQTFLPSIDRSNSYRGFFPAYKMPSLHPHQTLCLYYPPPHNPLPPPPPLAPPSVAFSSDSILSITAFQSSFADFGVTEFRVQRPGSGTRYDAMTATVNISWQIFTGWLELKLWLLQPFSRLQSLWNHITEFQSQFQPPSESHCHCHANIKFFQTIDTKTT